MKFRILSDVHLEQFGPHELGPQLPVTENEKDTVLLCAGDIGVASSPFNYIPFMKEMSERFKYVIHIAGNHEFYRSSFVTARNEINEHYKEAGISHNVRMYERETLEFDGVRIICATLWTDMDKNNAVTKLDSQNFMNDYRMIHTGRITDNPEDAFAMRLTPEDTVYDFGESRRFITNEIDSAKADGKRVIVMTHHAPSRLSISPQFASSPVNGAFVSDLSEEILEMDYDMTWIHGHVHQNHDYTIGKCRVLCNPYGYGTENQFFIPDLEIDV